MKTVLITLCMGLLATAGNCQTEETQIKAVLTDMWDAIEKNDLERYASHLHPDISVFGETNTYLDQGKDLEVGNVKRWLEQANSVHTEMHHPIVTIRDDVAWLVYYWTDSGKVRDENFSSQGKSTRIFVKEDGKWLCIHSHFTLVD